MWILARNGFISDVLLESCITGMTFEWISWNSVSVGFVGILVALAVDRKLLVATLEKEQRGDYWIRKLQLFSWNNPRNQKLPNGFSAWCRGCSYKGHNNYGLAWPRFKFEPVYYYPSLYVPLATSLAHWLEWDHPSDRPYSWWELQGATLSERPSRSQMALRLGQYLLSKASALPSCGGRRFYQGVKEKANTPCSLDASLLLGPGELAEPWFQTNLGRHTKHKALCLSASVSETCTEHPGWVALPESLTDWSTRH